jgi:hypothetical protein
MGAVEVETFLSYLATQRQVTSSTQNQALSAISFYIVRYWKLLCRNQWGPSIDFTLGWLSVAVFGSGLTRRVYCN